MEWNKGNTVYFSIGRRLGFWPVFTAIIGRATSPALNTSTKYIYLPQLRLALAVHNVERLTDPKEREAAHIDHQDMPDAIPVDGITAKKINTRRHDNSDCQFKGCHDRYHCIWFNPDSEKDAHGRRKPYNKIPKSHRVGDESCPRFIDRESIKVNKRKLPTPPQKPPLILYSIE